MDPYRAQLFVVSSNILDAGAALPASRVGDWNMYTGRGEQRIHFGVRADQPVMALSGSRVSLAEGVVLDATGLQAAVLLADSCSASNVVAPTATTFLLQASNLVCSQNLVCAGDLQAERLTACNLVAQALLAGQVHASQSLTCAGPAVVEGALQASNVAACNLWGDTVSGQAVVCEAVTGRSVTAQSLAASNATLAGSLTASQGLSCSNLAAHSITLTGSILKDGVEFVSARGLVSSQWQARDGSVFIGTQSNVGIGTDTPVSPLEVVGDITCSGTLRGDRLSTAQVLAASALLSGALTACNATISGSVLIGILSNAQLACSNARVQTLLEVAGTMVAASASFSNLSVRQALHLSGPLLRNGVEWNPSDRWQNGCNAVFCAPGTRVGVGGLPGSNVALDVLGTTRTAALICADVACSNIQVISGNVSLSAASRVLQNSRDFQPWRYGPTNSNAVFLAPGMSVGIGRSSPAAALDIAGDAAVSGSLVAACNVVVGGQDVAQRFFRALPLGTPLPRLALERSSNLLVLEPAQAPGRGAQITWNGIVHPVLGMVRANAHNDACAWSLYTQDAPLSPLFGVMSYTSSGYQHPLTITKAGQVGIGTREPGAHLDLASDSARKLTTATWVTGSDRRVKQNIVPADLQRCYDNVRRIPLCHFSWDPDRYPGVRDRAMLGFIAQDVEPVFPKAVQRVQDKGLPDFRCLDSDQLYKCLYGAVQMLIQKVEALEKRVQ